MGRDKAFVNVDGIPMAARVAGALRVAGCDPVIAIGGNASALAELGLVTIADRWPGEGPLGGVITALTHFANDAEPNDDAPNDGVVEVAVVMACDLPYLSASVVEALLHALGDGPGAADVALAMTDRPHPLCAAWRLSAAGHLSAQFAAGGRRMLDAVSGLRVSEVAVDPSQLINVNTVADLSL